MPFSRGSSRPRDPTQVSHIAGGFYLVWATREASKCYFYDVVPSYPWRATIRFPSGHLKLQVVPRPVHTMFCLILIGGPEAQVGKQWLLTQVGQSRAVWEFIMQLETSYNLRFMNSLFLEFSISYFWTVVDRGWPQVTKAMQTKTVDKGTSVLFDLKISDTLINVAGCLGVLREQDDPFPVAWHGTPPQYSWLENPMDRGAWQVTVHAVTESWTRLKQLSM